MPGIVIADTVKAIDAAAMVDETLDRNRLRLVQTPQAFAFDLMLDAHRRAAAAGREDLPTMPRSPNGPATTSASSPASPAM